MSRFRLQLASPALACVGFVAVFGSAVAAPAGTPSEASLLAQYQRERAVCTSGRSNQDTATCLREAGAALSEGRRGGLDNDPSRYAANANQRCARLPTDQGRDCMARMQGQGTTTGSATSGGIYRELVTRETAQGVPMMPESGPPATSR